jgi:hypothetical protein
MFKKKKTFKEERKKLSWEPVTHSYNPSYLASWDREDHSSRLVQANSSQDPVSKITREEWNGGVAKAVECLLCK